MILISHLNFTTKRERIPYILAFFESCLLEYLKSQVDVDKSTETQDIFLIVQIGKMRYNNTKCVRKREWKKPYPNRKEKIDEIY